MIGRLSNTQQKQCRARGDAKILIVDVSCNYYTDSQGKVKFSFTVEPRTEYMNGIEWSSTLR